MASREHQRPLTTGADPQRWIRLLDWLRIADRLAHRVVATFEGSARMGPQRSQDLQRLTQAPNAMIQALNAIHLVLGLRPRGSDAELQSSAGEVVDRDGDLGQQR